MTTCCTSCGTQLVPGDRFCAECGTAVPDRSASIIFGPMQMAPPAPTAEPYPSHANRGDLPSWMGQPTPNTMPPESTRKPRLKTFFGFRGRVGRLYFWGFNFALSAVFLALIVIEGNDPESGPGALVLLGYLVSIPLNLATTAKRWHDRNKSGWYVLVVFIPIVGGIWTLIECGLYPAVDIRNRYGAPGSGSPFS